MNRWAVAVVAVVGAAALVWLALYVGAHQSSHIAPQGVP